MASTYSTNLALELIATGEQSGTWGATTNTNLGTLLEQAVSGYVTQAITDGADTTITIPNGATGVARNMFIEMTGALTGARNLIVPANKKLYFIYNNTTGSQTVTVKVSGQTGVAVAPGVKLALVCNGTDVVNAVGYISPAIADAAGDTIVATAADTVARFPAYSTVAAHATTSDIWTSAYTLLTGTAVTFTDFADADFQGQTAVVVANAAHILTDGVNIEVQGNANYTCTAGDVLVIQAKTTTTFQVSVLKADGTEVSVSGSGLPQGRLTLTTAVPVTTSDVTGATTLYYTPYQGAICPIYDGARFSATAFTELSQATTDSTKSPAAVAASKVYDIFVWNDSGTIRCTRGPAWTNDTTRGYTLTMTNGILLNTSTITNGPAALRGTYVGTVYSDASSQLNDSLLKRHVWNTYNRTPRPIRVIDTTDTWTYSTNAYRQANGNTANQVDFLRGLDEDELCLNVAHRAYHSVGGNLIGTGIGIDSTTANNAQIFTRNNANSANQITLAMAEYRGFPGIGRHYAAWLEIEITGVATTTWEGDSGGGSGGQTGLSGNVLA